MPISPFIQRIRARISRGQPNDHPGEWLAVQPPVGVADLEAAEKLLSFPLPELLQQLYLEVGNGGFGPVFGLIPLSFASLGDEAPIEAEFALVTEYQRLRKRFAKERQKWPAGLVPVFYCGATVFEFVDCNTGRTTWFDDGSEELSDMLDDSKRWPGITLDTRLEAWLAGRQVW